MDGAGSHGPDTRKRPRAAEQDRADAAGARHARAGAAPKLDPAKPVFLDGAWATTATASARGRAPRGERPVCRPVPHGRWRATILPCGLCADGPVAPPVLDGAIDGPAFLARVGPVGDQRRTARLDGPDPNRIELAFSKLKRLLRIAAARTGNALQAAVGAALGHFASAECASYLRHCGYAQSGGWRSNQL